MMSIFVIAEGLMSFANVALEFQRTWQAAQSIFFLKLNATLSIEIASGVFAAGLVVGGMLTLRSRSAGRTCILIGLPLQLCVGLLRIAYYYVELFSTGQTSTRHTMLAQSTLSPVWMFITPTLIWTFFRRPEVKQLMADSLQSN